MKIFIICSKKFYGNIPAIKQELEEKGHEIYLPNCYDAPDTEAKMWAMGEKEHQEFKARMFKQSEELTSRMDAVLVLNFDKVTEGKIYKNYIGGATFLEIYDAFRLNKKIYFVNDIPDNMLKDELIGFSPIIIGDNYDLIK